MENDNDEEESHKTSNHDEFSSILELITEIEKENYIIQKDIAGNEEGSDSLSEEDEYGLFLAEENDEGDEYVPRTCEILSSETPLSSSYSSCSASISLSTHPSATSSFSSFERSHAISSERQVEQTRVQRNKKNENSERFDDECYNFEFNDENECDTDVEELFSTGKIQICCDMNVFKEKELLKKVENSIKKDWGPRLQMHSCPEQVFEEDPEILLAARPAVKELSQGCVSYWEIKDIRYVQRHWTHC
eukprot:MONOS_7838.1-p1 / transcript=MONOS_7838.1 / gene=MONOS_7838 / organism=Monocercomonoides_exilis_PA203 / gene_product=unspecified product / transcript_product=unspecified product / location=Mono_scaffold00279:2427-3330(+) / protein_length=248 / sequence_SO=supercontig / SO=protein_coding / is_pseudo=false